MDLTVEHLWASYGSRRVLEDVSFAADAGAVTVVVGRNGAGKSTLAACAMGEKRDYRGRVAVGGQDVRGLTGPQRARLLACLPQSVPRPHVTVRELAAFGRAPHASFGGRLSPSDWQAADRAVASVGLADMADAYVDRLSGGERKKAFFAMTLAQDTPVVLLDEPTAHLDVVSRFAFMDLLARLKEETGRTFLVVMHELPEMLRCADRIVVLHDRRAVFQGDAAACLAQEIPQRVFGVSVSGDRSRGYAVVPLDAGNV